MSTRCEEHARSDKTHNPVIWTSVKVEGNDMYARVKRGRTMLTAGKSGDFIVDPEMLLVSRRLFGFAKDRLSVTLLSMAEQSWDLTRCSIT